jgi:hypothetical protein
MASVSPATPKTELLLHMRGLIISTVMAGCVVFFKTDSFALSSLTVKGVTYSDAKLIKEYPQSAYISHATGRIFIQKSELSDKDANALNITRPVVDSFQQALDRDFRDLKAGKIHAASPLSPLEGQPQPLQPAQQISTPQPTAKVRPSSAASRAQRTALPKQRYMRPFDPSTVRLAMFSEGILPLKESEARDLFDGREISPLSSRCALDAFKAAKVMLGQLGPEHLPQQYRALVQPIANVASRVTAAAPRGPNSIPFEPSMSAASVAPTHTRPVATMGVDSHVHRIWHGADGSSATQVGNALFHSDGSISHGSSPAGGQFNTFHGSDGSVYHQSGAAMFPAGGGAGMFGAP